MASTRRASGSLNAAKICKNLLTSIGHCCSTLAEWSLWAVFGIRLALQPLVAASNDGIISNKGMGSGTLSQARCILLYCGWRVGGGVNASAVNGPCAHSK